VTDVEDEPTVFAGDLTGAVQDVAGSNDNLHATGRVRLADPDTAGVPAGVLVLKDADSQQSALSIKIGTYGTFTFFKTPGPYGAAAKEGGWQFDLDRDRPATLALKDGEEVTETFKLVYTITTPVLDGNGDPVLDDNGDPTVTVETIETDIVITITGADDPFMFNQPDGYVFSVNEDLAVDGIVGQVQAADYDADTQAPVTYSITAGDPDAMFEINANGQIVLKKGLDFETLPAGKSYTLTVQATDGPNTVTVDVTISVKDVEEGPAVVKITPDTADVDAIDVGTILTASLVTEDPDGLVGVAEWRWFYVSAPYASIGTGETYTIKEDDRGEQIGVARVYQDGIGGKPIGENEARDVLGKVIPRVAVAPEVNTESGDNTVAAQVDKASKVETGDGSDTITDGNRNDVIIGGKGDDNIDLGHDNGGNDQDQVIYGIGDKSAEDGGDTITNFTRGRDSFIFELAANAETNAIEDMDDFISYLNGGTPDDLSDDQLLVGLDFNINSDGNVELTGLTFHFEDSVFFGGGRISIPVVTIDFSNPMTEAQIISALGGDEAVAATLVNSDGILTNLDYLDDLLGGPDAVGYQVEIV
jgi:VCBS repeat-containing protein